MTPEDSRAEPPEGKPTVKFDPPPKWAEAMFGRVHEAINASDTSTKAEIRELRTTQEEHGGKLDACISGVKTLNGELEDVKADLNQFKGATNARLDGNSMRAKQESLHGEEQDQKIAQLSESQMAALLKAAAKTPLGQKVVNGVVLLVLAALGYGTFWLSTHSQQPTVIQQVQK